MGDDYNWNNLPIELLMAIVPRLSFAEDYARFKAVSKSWKAATKEVQKPVLPHLLPLLLLAEEVAPGGILAHAAFDDNDIDDKDTTDEDSDDNDIDEIGNNNDDANDNTTENSRRSLYSKYLSDLSRRYDYRNNSIGSSRGLYSIFTGKTYNIELPEAAGRLVLGTNKGWLVTLGRDLEINLLHPLFRHQIPLPHMLTFPNQYDYDEDFRPEDRYDMFIVKVVLSSRVPMENTRISLADKYNETSPIVMAVYGECRDLGFARLGDKVWTNVKIPSHILQDIIYHKGKFYTVDCGGAVFVCHSDDDNKKGELKGTKIASLPFETVTQYNQNYLVETCSESGLLLVVRTRRLKRYEPPQRIRDKYRSINFRVWKLELNYCECDDIPSCTLMEENNLGNEAIFVGLASSVSLPSSEIIKSNCIYFTDDNHEGYYQTGGGHDMGIFNMESQTVEHQFQVKSMHPISPPLWYI